MRRAFLALSLVACNALSGVGDLSASDDDAGAFDAAGAPDASGDVAAPRLDASTSPESDAALDAGHDAGPFALPDGGCALPSAETFAGTLAPRWELQGAAAQAAKGGGGGGSGITLTTATPSTGGRIVLTTPIPTDVFDVSVKVQLSGSGLGSAGDGISVAFLKNEPDPVPAGKCGGGGMCTGGTPGFAFDADMATDSALGDPIAPFVGLKNAVNDTIVLASAPQGTLSDGKLHTLEFKGASSTASASLDGTLVMSSPFPRPSAMETFTGYLVIGAANGQYYAQQSLLEITVRAGTTGPCAASGP